MGAVIAGGRASRFGRDKALAEWRGRPLLDRAREALAPWSAAVVVCGGDRAGVAALPDLPAPGLGPLGGIAAALAEAEARGFASVLTIGCDMPEVPQELLAALTATTPGYCLDAPVLGHWPAGEAASLIDFLSRCGSEVSDPDGRERHRGLSVRRWAASIDATPIPAPAPLRNVNTPADLLA